MKHIPNILSCIRIAMVGLFIWLFVSGFYVGSLLVYVAAFLTDVMDGYLARRFNWITNIGKLLDPFADKLMLITVLACLHSAGWLPWYIFTIVLVKELLMICGGYFVLKKRKVAVFADWWGKIATGLFFISISTAMIGISDLLSVEKWLPVVIFVAALCVSICSLFHYAYLAGIIGKKYKDHTPFEDNSNP